MDKTSFKKVGEENRCPHCKKELSIIPSRKKRCEFCNKYIYVRTRPVDRKKVLVTEKQKEEIDEQWDIYFMAREDTLLSKDPEFVEKRIELKKRFGREPLINDIKWGIYNDRILKFSSTMEWGLYRNNKLDMAQLLIKEGRLKEGLNFLLEVCYLDLNGPWNVPTFYGKIPSREMMKEFGLKEFELKVARLAPGVISMVQESINKLGLSNNSTKKLFIEINERVKPLKDMPLTPAKAWKKIQKELRFRR